MLAESVTLLATRMAAGFGKIEEYEFSQDWEQYVERLTFYFEANDVTSDEKKRAILLTVCGSSTYRLICDLFAPIKPGTKSFKEITDKVKEHIQPKPSEIVQRFKFHTCSRQEGESVASYVAQLRNTAQHCNFGDTLDLMLRDRLVCGINDDRIQRRLLAVRDLTFQNALETATAMEMASHGLADLQKGATSSSTATVNVVEKQNISLKPSKVFDVQNECYRCGGRHGAHECSFKDSECHFCHKRGHIARKCRMKSAHRSQAQQSFRQPACDKSKRRNMKYSKSEDTGSDTEESEIHTMFCAQVQQGKDKQKPYVVEMNIDSKKVMMEIDTGASVTVLCEATLRAVKGKGCFPLTRSKKKLRTYTGEEIPVLGTCRVSVSYKTSQPKVIQVLVVKGNGPDLLGRDWLQEFRLDWGEILHLKKEDTRLKQLLYEFDEVFEDTRGTVKGAKAKIYIDPAAKPRYFKPRPVPHALRQKISDELDKMEAEGTIEKVQFSDWAAPIVPVLKPDNSVRICGDYKVTVNQVSKLDNYPIPKTDDLLADLSGGKYFTKLDLTQAYLQLELDDASKEYTTINTHKGLYRYNRLPYGISSAPGIFQRTMENILQGIPQVRVRIDDILVTGCSEDDHIQRLREVMKRLKDAGVRLKKKKCEFLASEIVYLGHHIDAEGIHPVTEKVRAIQEMPRPKDIKEVQAYLGMINYYSKFLPNMATELAPLYELLRKDTKWHWGKRQETAWKRSKEALLSTKVLVHFNPENEIVVSCDASSIGLGAVLSHRMKDGTEKPVAFVSRTLSKAERNYSQIEKEGLAVVFAVKKFHQYLFGHQFEVYTDHKPLLGLFKEDRQIPPMAAARIQRWALTLAAYEYVLKYREGKQNGNADGLSRLSLPTQESEEETIPGEIMMLWDQMDQMPITARQIKQWTAVDPVLSRILNFVQKGWPERNRDDELRPYFSRKTELSVHDGCILWGSRVVVPPKGRARLLQDLHEGHPGTCKMKGLARSYIWWPKMDSEIEHHVKECGRCQTNRSMPADAPLHPWEWPDRPWSRLHIDYAGPFMGRMFLIIIDAHSKWIEAYPMNTSTSSATIEKLRQSFAVHGLPETVVSDNGSCFTSEEFGLFMKTNGIRHIKSAPYHPSTNGLAERAVGIVKEGLKKQKMGSVETKLHRFLLTYRTTPHTTTGLSPSEMLFNRKVRTRLDLVQPSVERRVDQKQIQQKLYHDRAACRKFIVGSLVYIKNFGTGSKWLPGVVVKVTGPVSYVVKLSDGREQKRHVDHMLARCGKETEERHDTESVEVPLLDSVSGMEKEQEKTVDSSEASGVDTSIPDPLNSSAAYAPLPGPTPGRAAVEETIPHPQVAATEERRSCRVKSTPVRFKDYVMNWLKNI